MPAFDPTLPAANSPISSSELRNQLNALNDQANTINGTLSTLNSQVYNFLSSANTVSTLDTPFSNPPTHADLEAIRTVLNQLINALQT